MKLARRNVVLLLALAGLIAADIGLRKDLGPERAIGSLVDGLDVRTVMRLELSKPGAESLEVQRANVDAPWSLPAAYGYPAFAQQVDSILSQVASLSTLDLVGEDTAQHDRFGVGDSGTLLVLMDERGQTIAGLVQGAVAPDGAATYVRRADQNQVYRMPSTRPWPTAMAAFLDTTLVRIPSSASVQGFRASGQALPVEVVVRRNRTSSVRPWVTPAETVLSTDKVERGVLVRLNQLFHTGVIAAEPLPEDGADLLRFEIDLEGIGTEVLRFGEPRADGRIPVSKGSAPWTVAVDAAAFEPLVNGLLDLAGN